MSVPIINSLLCSLSQESREQLMTGARLVRLRRHRVLYNQDERSSNVYFMQTGLASIVLETFAGEQVEVGMIGSEGMVGISSLLGPAVNVTRGVLQLESSAFEVPMEVVRRCFDRNLEIRDRLLEFAQSYLYATERVAACNRVHLAPERLVRWLLMAQAYSHVGQLPFTHDFLAQMAAVQRTTVSAALNSLQADGLIEHGWGSVLIKDRNKLKLKACSCYQVIENLHQTLYQTNDGAGHASRVDL